jgi:hypothetical protein
MSSARISAAGTLIAPLALMSPVVTFLIAIAAEARRRPYARSVARTRWRGPINGISTYSSRNVAA